MWGKLTEKNGRTQTKAISEPKELYRFLAPPVVEVTNLAFDSDEVVWVSRKHAAEEQYIVCVKQIRSSVLTSPQELGSFCIAISTDWKRNRSITALIL